MLGTAARAVTSELSGAGGTAGGPLAGGRSSTMNTAASHSSSQPGDSSRKGVNGSRKPPGKLG